VAQVITEVVFVVRAYATDIAFPGNLNGKGHVQKIYH
jgi:hypothetical protein